MKLSFYFHSSYDNSQICSCSSDKTVILWDVATGQVTRKLRGHAGVSCAVYETGFAVVVLFIKILCAAILPK